MNSPDPDRLRYAQIAGAAARHAQGWRLTADEEDREIAELCIAAGADQALIERWIKVGRERAAAAAAIPYTGLPPGGLMLLARAWKLPLDVERFALQGRSLPRPLLSPARSAADGA